jgi:4-amino-4-deoxy-L-arabinose transferase-like glycosyltransferase
MTQGQVEANRALLRQALWLALAFGLLKFLLQTLSNVVMQHAGYGIFRDELYFIVCGWHLAWGYVDQPPMVPLLTRASELLFGLHSLAMFRMFASLAGGVEVALTGVLTWRMGGSRWAQALAMTGMLLAPILIAGNATISTSLLEPIFWMTVALALMQLARLAERGMCGGRAVAAWWIVMGVAAGLGVENKWSIFFFEICLLAALLLTRQRKLLWSWWFPVGFALNVLIALPNLLWEVHHGWATLVLLHNDQIDGKNVHVGPATFVLNQIVLLGVLMAPLWIAGVVWLVTGRRAKTFRFVGVTYLLFLPLMMMLHAKDYYLAAIYPLYFAAGAAAWDGWLKKAWLRRRAVPGYVALHAVGTAMVLPAILPVLKPASEIAYMQRLHLSPPKMETGATAALPQYFADMLDWRHKANLIADAYWSLPPAERKEAAIYAVNYGDASAVNVYRPDVPTAISGHQNYFFWGPRGHSGKVMIIFGDSIATDKKEFDSIEVYARDTNPYVEPYERGPALICKGLHGSLEKLWPKVRYWY